MTVGANVFEVVVEKGQLTSNLPTIKVMVPEKRGAIYVPRLVLELAYSTDPAGKTQEAFCGLHSHDAAPGVHVANDYPELRSVLVRSIAACPSVAREAERAADLIVADVQRELDDLPGQYL